MLNSRRSSYISRAVCEKPAQADSQPMAQPTTVLENDEITKMIVDTMRMLSKSIDELKQSSDRLNQTFMEMAEKIEDLSQQQVQFESTLIQQGIKLELLDSKYEKLKTDIEMLKQSKDINVEQEIVQAKKLYREASMSGSRIPVMPGTGFASVTTEYLRNLKKD